MKKCGRPTPKEVPNYMLLEQNTETEAYALVLRQVNLQTKNYNQFNYFYTKFTNIQKQETLIFLL